MIDLYQVNQFRKKRFGRAILLTNDINYVFLSESEIEQFTKGEAKGKLLDLMQEKGFLSVAGPSKEYIGSNFVDAYRKKNSHLFVGTTLHIIVPTLRCNQACIYCHSKSIRPDAKGCDMQEDTAKKVVDFIFQTPQKSIKIEFQGGEPLLAFGTIESIVGYIRQVNVKFGKDITISIVTNLTMMDDEKFAFIKKNKIHICTSLDGPKFLHDQNRSLFNTNSSHDIVTKWIKRLKSEYDVNALMVTTRQSLPYHKEIIDEYIRQGFFSIQLKPLNYLEKGKLNWEKIGYTPEEFIGFYRRSMDYIMQINKKQVFVELLTYYIVCKIFGENSVMYLDLQSPCGAAIGQLAYDHDGKIYSCDEGRNFELFNLGDVSSSDYKILMTSDSVCDLIGLSINDNFICDACVYKSYCGLCPVCSYSSTGNPVSVPHKSDRCKIMMGIFDHIFENIEKHKDIFHSWIKHVKKK